METLSAPALRRRYVNPVIGDVATFIETAAETGGAYSLIEVELAPGGGNGLHYHRHFSETFSPVEGSLSVQNDGQTLCLQPGESATVLPHKRHRFYNETDRPVRFLVRLVPGHPGFENSLRIAYGLAADGKVNSTSMPKNIYHLALVVEMGGTYLPGLLGLIQPLFRWLANRARRNGVERELMERYCGER